MDVAAADCCCKRHKEASNTAIASCYSVDYSTRVVAIWGSASVIEGWNVSTQFSFWESSSVLHTRFLAAFLAGVEEWWELLFSLVWEPKSSQSTFCFILTKGTITTQILITMKLSIALLVATVSMASAQEAKYRPVKERLMELRADRFQKEPAVSLLLIPSNATSIGFITSFLYTTA